MYGKMKKKKDGGSISKGMMIEPPSKGMMEDYSTVSPEYSSAEQSKKKKKKPKSKMPFIRKTGEGMLMKKYMAGGKVGRGCGAAMRGGGAVMKKEGY